MLRTLLQKMFTHLLPPTLFECTYCCEEKPAAEYAPLRYIPLLCATICFTDPRTTATNPQHVCTACISQVLAIQIEIKHPSDICCPRCKQAWTRREVFRLLQWDGRRGRWLRAQYCRLEQSPPVLLQYEPPDDKTLALLIAQESRMCPFCDAPFQRRGGCSEMRCGRCRRCFSIYASRTVEDAQSAWELRETMRWSMEANASTTAR